MIQSDSLTLSYGDITAIQDLSLDVEGGEFVTVIGPSGCGKTTLLRAIGGLEEPSSGTITVGGTEPAAAQDRADIGFVFQHHALLPWKTARENVTFLRRLAGRPPDAAGASDLLARFGLDDFEDARPHELSGGMRQRVAIARALHLNADVLLMDEPFGELDELTREDVGVEVRRVWREERKTVVFVTHSVPEAVLLADRCLIMDGPPGRIAAEFDVSLPQPRDAAVLESNAFAERVSALRRQLRERTTARTGHRPSGEP